MVPAIYMRGPLEGDTMREQKRKQKQVAGQQLKGFRSLLDLYKGAGAVAQPTRKRGKVATDSMLALYKDRLTYTFVMDREVASIHYDCGRGEIFFKGHNIRNMDLTEKHRQALMDLGQVLLNDQKGKEFSSDYEATLARVLADKE